MKTFLVAAILVACATPASATCKWGRFSVMFGSDGPAMADADSGQECVLRVRAGRDGHFDTLGVVRQAKHGNVKWNGSLMEPAYVYTSAPGYKGPDDFVIFWNGANTRLGFSGKSTVSVSMDVQ
ncbi:MAG: hypothetical protein ACLQJL_06520 [Roseiarcus sp.]